MNTFQERIIEKQYRYNIIAGLISAGLNYASQTNTNLDNMRMNRENLKFQQEKLDYDKALQERIFEREDTAHRREINDLMMAGINPLATATGGSGANAGQIVPTEAPQNTYQQQAPEIDLSAMLQETQQFETMRNNKATEKIQADQIKNQRAKIESDETLKMIDQEQNIYIEKMKDATKRYEIALEEQNWKEINKIEKEKNQITNQHNKTMERLQARDLTNKEKMTSLSEEELRKLKLPESQMKILNQMKENEKLNAEIKQLALDGQLTEEKVKNLIIKNSTEKGHIIINDLSTAIKSITSIIPALIALGAL